jgi:hypothetical protein
MKWVSCLLDNPLLQWARANLPIRRLAIMLPEGVIIVTTGAGFKMPWFKPVKEQGWYCLCRV